MPSARLAISRVLEEQLVEIAHAVEQQAIRVRRLDLDELLHHRRRRADCLPARCLVDAYRRFVVHERVSAEKEASPCLALYGGEV